MNNNPMRFACDSLPDCQGQIVERVGGFVIIEGMATDSGYWFAKGTGGARRFQSRQEAVDYIAYAQDAEPSMTGKEPGVIKTPGRDPRIGPLSQAAIKKPAKAKDVSVSEAQQNAARTFERRTGLSWAKLGPERQAAVLEKAGVSQGKAKDVSVSEAQHKAMSAAAGGKSKLGIPKSVGEEFSRADKGKFGGDAEPFENEIRKVLKELNALKERSLSNTYTAPGLIEKKQRELKELQDKQSAHPNFYMNKKKK